MSETELRVICKNCGSEVSPYVTECPYCGARLRKRAPKLERKGDALEAKVRRRPARRLFRRRARGTEDSGAPARPYATAAAILGSAVLLLVVRASGEPLASLGALVAPVGGDWWQYFTASFAYEDVGYLFVVAVALAVFASSLERRLGSMATATLLLAAGSLGMLAAAGVASTRDEAVLIAGGNAMALGALTAWFVIRRAESRRSIDRDYDPVGVTVAAAVLLALPIFESSADPFAGLAGVVVGGLAGLASALSPSD